MGGDSITNCLLALPNLRTRQNTLADALPTPGPNQSVEWERDDSITLTSTDWQRLYEMPFRPNHKVALICKRGINIGVTAHALHKQMGRYKGCSRSNLYAYYKALT